MVIPYQTTKFKPTNINFFRAIRYVDDLETLLQNWKSGQLTNDPSRMTAVELPYISRNDL